METQDQTRIQHGTARRADNDMSTRSNVKRVRALMRESPAWKRAVAIISSISILYGYERPQHAAARFASQSVAHALQSLANPASDDADITQIECHIEQALSEPHPLDEMHEQLQPDTQRACEWIANNRDCIQRAREQRFAQLKDAFASLESWNQEFLRSAPNHIRNSALPLANIAAIDAISAACGLPDLNLPIDLCAGAPAIGLCPDSGCFRANIEPAELDAADLDHNDWNERCVTSTTARAQNPECAEEIRVIWEKTQKEIASGTAVLIGSKADADRRFGKGKYRAMACFGVKQKDSFRRCENAKLSLHNKCTTTCESLICETADFPVRVVSMLYKLLGDFAPWSFGFSTDDIESAFRRFPCSQPQYTVFTQWDPTQKRVLFFHVNGFNFGLKSAPVTFNRLTFFLARAATRLIPAPYGFYFDDFVTPEPGFCGASGKEFLRLLAKALRIPFSNDEKKNIIWKTKNVFLGVESDFTNWHATRTVQCSVPKERQSKLLHIITSVLQKGSFEGSRGILKIAGQLQFALSWCTGRFGRAALQPLFNNKQRGAASERLSAAVKAALSFFCAILSLGIPARIFSFRRKRRKRIYIWSDAMYDTNVASAPGALGFAIYIEHILDGRVTDSEWLFARAACDQRFMQRFVWRKTYIGQLELLAAVAVYYSIPHILQGENVIHYIDNSSAVAALVKGYSQKPDSVRILHALWALASGLKCAPWFKFVRSKANIADHPSRNNLEYITNVLKAREINMTMPPFESWSSIEQALAVISSSIASVQQQSERRTRKRKRS